MYSTCLFCHSDLGANEVIESFPVGRRLAFDSAKGRLWVICKKCERWNLTPLDERWEAVEQCERLFSQTRLRVSSDNIGLSRLREGLELVRIGNPLRPEMAAWRYGDQFGRRRTKHLLAAGGVIVVGAGVLIGVKTMGILGGGGYGVFQMVNGIQRAIRDRMVRARVAIPGRDTPVLLRGKDMKRIVVANHAGQLTLRIPDRSKNVRGLEIADQINFVGQDALRVAAAVLPGVNLSGATKSEVDDAVQYLDRVPDPYQLFLTATGITTRRRRASFNAYGAVVIGRADSVPPAGSAFVDRLPKPVRLALEMAAHEDIERRAMQGELAMLEAAWRQAEEIAGISDDMFLPQSVEQRLVDLKAPADPAVNR